MNQTVQYHEYKAWYERTFSKPVPNINTHPESWLAWCEACSNGTAPIPTKCNLYPTMATEQSVIDMAISQLPYESPNAITALLMTFKNTILNNQGK